MTIVRGCRYLLSVSENNWLAAVRFGADGLVPVVAQESRSGDVLMLAYANREALERTAATGQAHYYSRSRAALWRKGETSGHGQAVREIRLDCDGDSGAVPGGADRPRLPHRHPNLLLGRRRTRTVTCRPARIRAATC